MGTFAITVTKIWEEKKNAKQTQEERGFVTITNNSEVLSTYFFEGRHNGQ